MQANPEACSRQTPVYWAIDAHENKSSGVCLPMVLGLSSDEYLGGYMFMSTRYIEATRVIEHIV